MPAFGQSLRNWRVAKGVTVGELVRQTGITSAYVYQLERGEGNPPSDRFLIAMADALHLSRDDVFAAAGRLPPDLRPHTGRVIELYRRRPRRKTSEQNDFDGPAAA